MADEAVIYRADHVLEYPYVRSVGPVAGAFLTGGSLVAGALGTLFRNRRNCKRARLSQRFDNLLRSSTSCAMAQDCEKM